MAKKILVVGAGPGQLPAIQKAKELGFFVITVDKNPSAAGMLLADKSFPIDIIDKEGILKIAQEHDIDGITTMQSDLPVPTIGFINDALNLVGVSFQSAIYCSNKIETRRRLKNRNCSQPNFVIISAIFEAYEALEKIGLPCVLKAPDSSGSRGVIKINKKEDIESAFKEASKYTTGQKLLLEEYIPGLEFGAQTFSVNGKCEIVLLHNDTMSPPPYMIPIGHSFPFKHSDNIDIEMIISDIKNAVEALEIFNGPANVDIILDPKSNKIKIIEIGARIGATCLPELIFYHTGIDWVKETIKNSVGEDIDLEIKNFAPVAALILSAPKDGFYNGFNLSSHNLDNDILEFEITANKGDAISILRKGTDRIGKILAYGTTTEDAERKVMSFKNNINILVDG